MKGNHKYIVAGLVTFFFAGSLLLGSCKKNEEVSNRTALETYINKSGHNMEISRYLNNLPVKTFSIANNDTLFIESPDNSTADTSLTIRHADSALVLFADGKSYKMYDTLKTPRNFLDEKNFASTISVSGKIHYLRFTFNPTDYQEAK